MKEGHRNYRLLDPLDPARLYEKYSWASNRVFEHKVVAICSKLDGKIILDVWPDSRHIKADKDIAVVRSFAEGELLHTTTSGAEIEHVNKARSGIVKQRIEIPAYPNTPIYIPGKFREKKERE